MRIIAGTAKGRRVNSVKNDHTRPTSDRVKEALFNILGYPLNSFKVLDLFAGTGNLGLEALSRGAQKTVFVDLDHECYQVIKKNIADLGFKQKSVVLKKDCLQFIKDANEEFDIILMDPPYNISNINEYIYEIFNSKILSEEGVIVVEHDNSFKSEIEPSDKRKYGQTYLSFYKWLDYKGA